MQYMLLIYTADEIGPQPGSAEFGQLIEDYGKFGQEASEAGVMVGGEALLPVNTATSLNVRDGKVTTTDGPFAETKETLGGYYILDCKDLDEALSYAAKTPSAAFGTIEVRPIMVFE